MNGDTTCQKPDPINTFSIHTPSRFDTNRLTCPILSHAHNFLNLAESQSHCPPTDACYQNVLGDFPGNHFRMCVGERARQIDRQNTVPCTLWIACGWRYLTEFRRFIG